MVPLKTSPPNSKESEMMVLGCMLTSINSLNIASDLLDDSDFYYTEHQLIFQILKSAYKQDRPADVHLVCEELKRLGKLEPVGGVGYVTTLAQYAGTSAYIEEYAELVKSKAILRRMIQAAQIVEKSALAEPKDVHGALDEAQSLFFKISQTASAATGTLVADLLRGVKGSAQQPYLQQIQERQESFRTHGLTAGEMPRISGIPTGYIDLDKVINGLNPSHLLIVAGRPAMGKTALVMNIAEHVCFKQGKAVGIFSLEMTAEQLLHRLVSSQSAVEAKKITSGALSGLEFQQIVAAVNQMQSQTMVIDDRPGLRVSDLRAAGRRMKEVYDVDVIFIDYLQLIDGGPTRNSDNRQMVISDISRGLKTMARELNVAVICAAQLSRKVEERAGHRPMLSDLRESGSIEQDADIILFPFRPEYYDPNNKPGMAEVIVGKNRHGSVGSVPLTFVKELVQFRNYTSLAAEQSVDAFATV